MAVNINYYSGSFTYNQARYTNVNVTKNNSAMPNDPKILKGPNGNYAAYWYLGGGFVIAYTNNNGSPAITHGEYTPPLSSNLNRYGYRYQYGNGGSNMSSSVGNGCRYKYDGVRPGTRVYLYDSVGGTLLCSFTCPNSFFYIYWNSPGLRILNADPGEWGNVYSQSNNRSSWEILPNTNLTDLFYYYFNTGNVSTRLANGSSYIFKFTNTSTYITTEYQLSAPASVSVSVTGLTASGTTVSINSSYSGRVLVSTDGTNYYYSSGTSLPVSLGTSSRTVYVAILSTSGSALGLSNGSSYTRSTLDSKISTYNTNETRNNNANSAASSFDSLYNSISGNISAVTTDNLSSLESYLNTIASSSTSDSRYTTRKTKYDTLKRDYDAYQIRISNLSQIRTNIAGINTVISNTKNTTLPEIVTRYSNTYDTGRDVYNIVLEKLNTLKKNK